MLEVRTAHCLLVNHYSMALVNHLLPKYSRSI